MFLKTVKVAVLSVVLLGLTDRHHNSNVAAMAGGKSVFV